MKAPRQFGRVPYRPVNAGLIAQMKEADVRVYVVLCAHLDETFTGSPGLDRIRKLSGLKHQSSVCRAIKRLEQLGAILRIRGGGRANANEYRINPNCRPGEKVSGSETVAPERQNDNPKLSPSSAQTVSLESSKCRPTATRTEQATEINSSSAAASLEDRLVKQGLDRQSAEAMASHPNASHEQLDILIRNAEYKASRGDLRSRLAYITDGLKRRYKLVAALQHHDPREEIGKHRSEAIDKQRREQAEQSLADRERVEAENQALRDAVEAIPPDDIPSLIEAACQQANRFNRRHWGGATDPFSRIGLAQAVVSLARQRGLCHNGTGGMNGSKPLKLAATGT